MKKRVFLWTAIVFALMAAVVFIGCGEDGNNGDTPASTDGFTVKVTGDLPKDAMGASLLHLEDIETTIATGVNSGGTFVFYHPKPDQTPDFDKKFSDAGSYVLAVAQIEMVGVTPVVKAIHAWKGYQEDLAFSDEVKSHTVDWSEFVDVTDN